MVSVQIFKSNKNNDKPFYTIQAKKKAIHYQTFKMENKEKIVAIDVNVAMYYA